MSAEPYRPYTVYLYIELWMPRRGWRERSEAERRHLVAEIGGGAARLLRLIRNDGRLAYPSGCAYVALWELPEEEQLEALDQLLKADWHDYFGEISARGTTDPPVEVLEAPGWQLSGNGREG